MAFDFKNPINPVVKPVVKPVAKVEEKAEVTAVRLAQVELDRVEKEKDIADKALENAKKGGADLLSDAVQVAQKNADAAQEAIDVAKNKLEEAKA